MHILIVDDDAVQRDLLQGFLEHQGYSVHTAADGTAALETFHKHPVSLVLLDQRMPGPSGQEVLAQMKRGNPLIRAIMITAFGSVETAVAVMKLGADEFFEKPVDLPRLLQRIQSIEQQLATQEDVATVETALADRELPLKIVAESPGMQEVISLARRFAASPFAVLVHGETGTGKELVARLIHLLSGRSNNPFIEVNCAAIPENLFESELFGHEKGSFTGATSARRGRFELADGGTLFLDEIGDMPLFVQPKLLRALQEKNISRVGSERALAVDARLVCATNRDLKAMADEGQFREDLYFRVKVLEIALPPLRRRKEDIAPLARFFLERYASRPTQLSHDALNMLMKYPFPGNVRELENIIQRTVTLARSSVIRPADLPEEVRRHQATSQGTLADCLEAVEKEMLVSALEKNNWVQTQAAAQLGISERVLRYKMKKYALKHSGGA